MTGLAEAQITKSTLHAWERRFCVALTSRDESGWRYFTRVQVERLSLLRECTVHGARISSIIALPDRALREIIGYAHRRPDVAPLLHLIRMLDEDALRRALSEHLAKQGIERFITVTLPTLMADIGEGWRAGEIAIRAEHMASQVVTSILIAVDRDLKQPSSALKAIVGTLPDEQHELGALSFSILLRHHGVDARYLGGSLPLEDIALAARDHQARLVAISCPTSKRRRVLKHLVTLRALLHPNQILWAGGSALSKSHEAEGIAIIENLTTLSRELDALRQQFAASMGSSPKR